MMKWISNIAAVVWFCGVLVWWLLLMLFVLLLLPNDISKIMASGFGTQTIGFTFLIFTNFFIGITMLVPAFRKCFHKLPWLYPYVVIITADIVIVSIGIEILNYGYSVQNDTRHTLFCVLMVIQMIVCRIAMCIYCHRKPIRIVRDNYE